MEIKSFKRMLSTFKCFEELLKSVAPLRGPCSSFVIARSRGGSIARLRAVVRFIETVSRLGGHLHELHKGLVQLFYGAVEIVRQPILSAKFWIIFAACALSTPTSHLRRQTCDDEHLVHAEVSNF